MATSVSPPGMASRMWLLCLLLCMEMTPTQANKIPQYGLFIPPDLYHPSTGRFCLHASPDLQGFSHISVDLKTSSGNINLYTTQPDSPTMHCQSFQVPEPSGATEKVTIIVYGQNNEGNKVEFSSKELTIRKKSTGTLIQTDKSMYLPGQNVMIRMVHLDQEMEVMNKTYSLVQIQDSQKNRMAQWRDVHAESRIAELSYQLDPDVPLGTYTIQAEDAKMEFIVEKYVLPKYEVAIDGPDAISVLDDKMSISVSAKYTYGEKVQGDVFLKVCQKKKPRYWYWWRSTEERDDKKDVLCYTESGKTDNSGKLKLVVNLSQFRMRGMDYARELEVEASMEEEGTEVKLSAPNKLVSIMADLTKITFKDTKSYYQPGTPYRGKMVLESYDGKRLGNKKVTLSIRASGMTRRETYVTDPEGEVSFQCPTDEWGKDSVTLQARSDEEDEPYSSGKVSARHGTASLYLKDLYIPTKSSVYIHPVKSSAQLHEDVKVNVDFTLEEETKDDAEFFYVVMVDNKVSTGGKKRVKKPESLSGSFQLSLPMKEISPSGKLLVYTVSPSGRMAADTTQVQVPVFLKHKVSLKFSEDEVLPGSSTKLQLQANGGSLCALRAVDKSVVMMKPEAELSESKIKNMVTPKRTTINTGGPDYNYCRDKRREEENDRQTADSVGPWGWWGGYSYAEKKKDVKDIIQEMDVFFLTSLDIVAPTTCSWRILPGLPTFDDSPGESPSSLSEDDDDEDGGSSEPRMLFPETWLWSLEKVPESGSHEMSVTAPDTITEWSAQMMCAGPGGLGLSRPASLKAFQPFFIEVTLPYTMKKEESFTLKASTFNYMDKPLMISASLPPSDQYEIANGRTSEKPFCVPGGVKKTVTWDVTPKMIGQMNITVMAEAVQSEELCGEQKTVIPKKGRRDVVIHSVMVVPEGTLVEKTHNSLLVSDATCVSEKMTFELPPSYVLGSEKSYISVCGDIMGPAMNNIANLLQMSYGCGEQNMVLFAPNIFILWYLKISGQHNPSVLEKGKEMLDKGHRRQLLYRRKDWSFSAFGNSDPEGSTWLTTFVMKCFSMARELCAIDEETITQAMKWLKSQQKPNGCFKTTGRLLNNGMKGGVNDEVSLTSYVAASMLESGTDPSDPIVVKALECIEKEPLDVASIYKLALKAYAYTLAKREESRAATLQKLHEKATKAGGLLFWTQETKPQPQSYWSKPNSVDVEMTSYVLLSLASCENRTKKDLGDMAAIVRWLSKQQNPNGGFCSTQDTVVALQALAKFAGLTSSSSGSVTVDVTTEKGFHHRFQVDLNNRLLMQKVPLPEVCGEYEVTVCGKGTVIAQGVQRYNVLPEAREDTFQLSVNPQCVKSDLMEISVEFRYVGHRLATNMVIVEIDMLSGYQILEESIAALKKSRQVKRVEKKEDGVLIYVEEVTSVSQTLKLQAEETVPVSGRKPANAKIYDYYITVSHRHPTFLKSLTISEGLKCVTLNPSVEERIRM
ncbi:alpha-2-macroglobulin-like protein 1 [Leptodactylus fuscus]|uniref:alpha-2-macroglobulin-like protein 1 n=1 Tax=Leptodactylus fuscus TaxID=238119 RepID=UPI003F4EA579